jgi:hypothetical protein
VGEDGIKEVGKPRDKDEAHEIVNLFGEHVQKNKFIAAEK